MKDTGRQFPAPPAGKSGWPWETTLEPLPDRMPDGSEWPRISVTVPSFNQAAYLEETLRSILLQGYPNLELFVMDGGSQDGSQEILEKYDPWIDAWVSEPDRGQSQAINKGWRQSGGDLLAYLNSDDYYLPGAFAKVALAWSHQPGVALVSGAIHYISSDSRLMRVARPHLDGASPLDLSLLEISAWYIPQQACFFARPALDQAGCWLREDLHYVMDRELMYRLCRLGRVVLLPDALAADRKHGGSKRQKDRLVLYREDRVAMDYCTWGGRPEARQRERIARARLAEGYWLSWRGEGDWPYRLVCLLKAIFLRPVYLKQVGPFKPVVRIARALFRKRLSSD